MQACPKRRYAVPAWGAHAPSRVLAGQRVCDALRMQIHRSVGHAQRASARAPKQAREGACAPQAVRAARLLILLAIILQAAWGFAAETAALTPGTSILRLSESAIQSNAEEVKMRLHSQENPGPFDITKEQYSLVVPKNYEAKDAWGLFIWISAGDASSVPADWLAVLAERHLLFVGALQSGNRRNIFDRLRMAVDVSVGLRKRCRVDERRVYISGFSGGARVASMLGVAFADLFTGTIPFMGVNFYTDLPASDGKTYGLNYIPDDEVLALAKKRGRFVLVTGEKDFNRANTLAAEEKGFQAEKFAHVKTLEVPGLGHTMPEAKWLAQGLEFLDAGKNIKQEK